MSLMRKQQQQARVIATMPANVGALSLPILQGVPTSIMGGQQLGAFLQASLEGDLKALKDIASHERRNVVKGSELVPKYRPYVERLKEQNTIHPLLGWFLVWCMDAGLIEEGLAHGTWCVTHHIALPDVFKSTPAFFVVDTLMDWAEGQHNAGAECEPYVSELLNIMDEASDLWPVPDTLIARAYRLLGLRADSAGNLEAAKEYLTKAMTLGAKVKTALDGVLKRLERESPPNAPDANIP